MLLNLEDEIRQLEEMNDTIDELQAVVVELISVLADKQCQIDIDNS